MVRRSGFEMEQRRLRPPEGVLLGLLPLFDMRSRAVYLIVGIIFTAEVVLFVLLGFSLRTPKLLDYLVVPLALVYSGTMFRRAGWVRMATALEGAGLCGTFGHIILLLQFPLVALEVGSPDEYLLEADHFLGFDWRSFALHFQDPNVVLLLREAYRSMIPQSAFVVSVLAWKGRIDRSWQFVTICLVGLLLSVAPLPFFAALGSYVGCGQRFPDVAVLENTCSYSNAIHQISNLGIRTIEPWMEVGIVSFPSFHAAVAIFIVWSIWPFKLARFALCGLNILMCISAITIGQHYLIDIIGGFVLAAPVIAMGKSLTNALAGVNRPVRFAVGPCPPNDS